MSDGVLPWRRLGRSAVAVTEVAFGGAAIGNLFAAVTALARTLTAGLSAGERAAVFGETAARTYGIGAAGIGGLWR